jgi:C_GCAxxG_C_C family probable redox protein
MDRPAIAKECMETTYNCAQSIVKTFASETGISENELIHLAFPFGAGLGREGYVCGALSGASMILGAKYGKVLNGKETYRDRIYGLTQELLEQFRKKQGSVLCKELLNFDLSKPEELLRAREAGVFTTKCPEFVQQAAEILEELLKEEP